MSYSSTSAAATSSCVESGLDAQRTTSAPPADNVRARFAVSVVTCRHAEMRCPASGCSRSKRSRIAASTGICRSAHAIRRTPSGARARSLTSCLVVVAIVPLSVVVSGYETLFVLALLPGDPVGLARSLGRDGRTVAPGFDCGPRLRVASQPDDERHVVELDVVAPPQLGEPAEELQVV